MERCAAPHAVQIGTSGWSYDDWVGPFYPPGTSKADYLAHYASRFDVVEVDSTYYASPRRSLVEGWAERTPPGFRFALKMPGEVTHKKVLTDCEGDVESLLEAVQPLGDKLLCVLLQFGYFNRAAFASAAPFFQRLEAFLARFAPRVQLACEIRNKSWLGRAYFDLLRAHRVPAVLVEHAWLPPIERLVDAQDVATGPFSYVRLIGDRQGIEAITSTWEKVVLDRTTDLARIAAAIRRIAERVDVVTFVNNHYAGHAPQTAHALRRALDA